MSVSGSTLPPTFDRANSHALFPDTGHDETARLNHLTNLNVHLGRILSPGVQTAYEKRVRPAYEKEHGHEPTSATKVRKLMLDNAYYQQWAALRRNTQEASQQASRDVTIRRLDETADKVRVLNEGCNTLCLNPDLSIPPYQLATDNHLMPGSYHEKITNEDVTAAATYEVSLFPIGGASFGPKCDGGGRALAHFIHTQFPNFKPKRIVDVGGGIGNNTLPFAEYFAEAEIIVLDTAAPLLRYGNARAKDLGYTNVRFVQGAAETMDLESGSVDLLVSVMFWHETSSQAVSDGLRRMHDILSPNGIMLHVEQPNFDENTSVFERFMRDWDGYYNNEPFWPKLHRTDMIEAMYEAGFDRKKMFDAGVEADIEPGQFQPWSTIVTRHRHETKELGKVGRKLSKLGGYKGERWWLFGAHK